ncbi:carbon-nitrogen hydrolase family protein [Epibacterium ulvae]|uniref:carbon-nitrogen hydrolase family protein n=1 Tax=Epibacterium ulvae TaxID=1156985 RepID=UPI001BFC7983|nr:carbon-nitrogen hydrolase family protein [Epibacterium ulvae]MBT8154680.1 carbon-nitrogen hydrolase family protein [Epibacterium ulvae]
MAGHGPLGKLVKVGVVQAAPVLLDLDAGVEKAMGLIDEAGKQGVELLNFPETWLPGYPWWIWFNPPAINMQFAAPYFQNAIVAGSEQDMKLRAACRRNNIHVVIGVSEREGGSLYMAQWHYGPEGQVISRRRKLKPTHVERSVFGEGDGSDMFVNKTELGNIGALCCWENLQPLSKYALFSQDEEIHCAAWPAFSLYAKLSKAFSPEVSVNVNQIYGVEGQCFVLAACSVIDKPIYDLLVKNEMHEKFVEIGGGYSRIFGPNGAEFGENIAHDKEGIVVVDIDLGLISHSKTAADPAGHYARPDALALMHNKNPRRPVIGFGAATQEAGDIPARRSSPATELEAAE